jgi:acyl-CoA reductase-like NAD-dependent aldehyde dehydrogenase
MQDTGRFKLTYSTMFDPPAQLHSNFDAGLERARRGLGTTHAMWVDGVARPSGRVFEVFSPIDTRLLLGRFALGTHADVDAAVLAARRAFPGWRAFGWVERVQLLRRAAGLIEERVYDISAAVALEVGKNRMEALGEVQETADLFAWYCDQMEANDGFVKALPNDPLPGFSSRNRTILKPHGVWAVIAPFNFPFALAGGPVAAALVTGNTVVFKVSAETAWSGTLLMDVLRDAGLPPGVVNHVTGFGAEVGTALVEHADVAGITFTGSHEVGMSIVRASVQRAWPKPCLVEMGGKNAAVVSRRADLDRAALGIVRSAFGLQGQKCSACSRVYVEQPVADALRQRLVALTAEIRIGDPTRRENWMGPVINRAACERYAKCVGNLQQHGDLAIGGERLTDGPLAHGWFVAPTVASAPLDYRLWREEKFIPLVLVGEVDSIAQAVDFANESNYGLTAGFYGAQEEIDLFLERIEAGVTYVNRPQGATTGAWPGYQPFGGWKGSGSTRKAIGSFWYLPQYLREQSQTIVD